MNNLGKSVPLVSIITPYFRAHETLISTIKSVQHQTFDNWELLIIDDHSNDSLLELTEDIVKQDSRIKIHTNTEQKGAAGARNSGLQRAQGRFIAFLDSDDLWASEKLEKQLKFMQTNDAAFSYGDYYSFKSQNDDDNPIISGHFYAPDEVGFNELCRTCSIGCLTVMLDKSQLPDFKMPLTPKEDYSLWLTLTKEGVIAKHYGGMHAYYRVGQKSLSGNKWRELKRQFIVLRTVAGLPFFKSLWCLSQYIVNGLQKHKKYRATSQN